MRSLYEIIFGSISSQRSVFSSLTLLSRCMIYINMEMTRERLDPNDMLLSLQIGFSVVKAAVACSILERTSAYESSSVTTALRVLNLLLHYLASSLSS